MGSDQVKGSPNGAEKCYEHGHRNNRGEPCGANAIKGKKGCLRHVGKSLAKAKAEGAVVVELRNWGLNGHKDLADPGLTLLKLVTQSAARCELYARLLAEAYEAADRLRAAGTVPQSDSLAEAYEAADRLRAAGTVPQSDSLAEETARLDLERILNDGAVAALIGHKYAGTQTSGVIATGEAIRGLVELEAQERDRCANFAAKAVAAGLAERMVRAQEQLAGMVAAAMERTLARLGLDPQSPEVRAAVRDELVALSSPVIEGSVAA